MSDGRLDKSPTHQHKAQGSLSYPVRRMRNTAVLVKWIEEHQANPYPTKAEKQLLAYYSGMNLTQLSTWFANARRRIKKIGMKTWLEGRSTFSLDYFPHSALQRPGMTGYADTSYHGFSSANPYASAYTPTLTGLQNSYAAQHHSPISLQTSSQRMPNGGSLSYSDSSVAHHSTNAATANGLYGGTAVQRSSLSTQSMMTLGMTHFPISNWPVASPTPLLPTSSSLVRQGGSNAAPLHSPLTAYSADTSHLRTQTLEVSDGTYSLQQHSPDQMLPECASGEPILHDNSKTQSSLPT